MKVELTSSSNFIKTDAVLDFALDLEQNIPEASTVRLLIRKPNGVLMVVDDEDLSKSGKEVSFEISKEDLDISGHYRFQLELTDEDEKLSKSDIVFHYFGKAITDR